jgi:serine/threonine protein kinase
MGPTEESAVLGDYDLLDLLGEGRTGVVFKARNRDSKKIVAVKVLHPQHIGSPLLLNRFVEEFQAAQSLSHPNVVRVLDFQRTEGRAFFVLEYVEGRSLAERLEWGGRFQLSEAFEVIRKIGGALDWLHNQGIIHQDVKPANVLFTTDGVAKLTELRLVLEPCTEQTPALPGAVLGTPSFMAPEQFHYGEEVDKRCDVYSLAATFYQLVTGAIPFHGDGPYEAWEKKTNDDFVPPQVLVPTLPDSVNRAVCQAMSGDRNLRQPTCREFIEQLTLGKTSDPETKVWELIFEDSLGKSHPIRSTAAKVWQLYNCKRNDKTDRLLVRCGDGPFKPLDRLPELADFSSAQMDRSHKRSVYRKLRSAGGSNFASWIALASVLTLTLVGSLKWYLSR